MILGNLPYFAAPNMIEAGITDVGGIQDTVTHDHRGQSCSHPPQFRHGQCTVVNFDISSLDGAMEPLGRAPSGRTLAESTQGNLDRLRTGDLAPFVAADPVGDSKDHAVLVLCMAAAGVLVAFAIRTDIA
jgi:hypothetical protein